MFSYEDYRQIIDIMKKSKKIKNFRTAIGEDEYVIMRHDVEFSVKRAYNLAAFEAEHDFLSTYFFQLTNNSYNLLSKQNKDLLKEIAAMGHGLGLHFHLNGLQSLPVIEEEIKMEIKIMSEMIGEEITQFSFHRPTEQVLKANIKIDQIINTYADEYFTYTPNMILAPPTITYLSDARHQWNYGLEPSEDVIFANKKIQILIHPYSWTRDGWDNEHNFKTLIKEKEEELIATIDNECQHFAFVRDKL